MQRSGKGKNYMKAYEAEYKNITEDEISIKKIQVCAEDFFCGLQEATRMIAEIEDSDWTIQSFKIIDGIDISNFIEPECNCPFCRASKTVLDKIAKFNCPECKELIVVAEDGWEVISCRKCNKELYRHLLGYSEGAWHYTDDDTD